MISSIIELLFPFYVLWKFKRNKKLSIDKVSFEKHSYYFELNNEIIATRLKEEHDRAQKIDEKTSKFIFGLSICFTAFGVSATIIAKLLPTHVLKPLIIFFLSFSSSYMLIGGIVSLGAFQLMAKFGYGTVFEYQKYKNEKFSMVHALIGQENTNLIRQVRNEVAYLCIRNGFVLLLISFILFSLTIIHSSHRDYLKNLNQNKIISTQKKH